MTDVIEPARTGRAKCRGCGEKIEKGELRFGETVPNPYADGEATSWFHVLCGADKRSDKFAVAMADYTGELPRREVLEAIVAAGIANPELARVIKAERAPTSRARCRECREKIDKGALRVVLEPVEDMGPMVTSYFVHATCAGAHTGKAGLFDKLARVSTELGDEDRSELEELV